LILDDENGEWVVQLDLDGTTLNPGDVTAWGFAGGEDFSLHLQGWSTNWDLSNDYSAQGLTSSWSMTKYINLYDRNGNLIYGTPRNGGALNVAPVASISGPTSLSAPGVIALDGSGSSDPDAGPSPLTWQWYLDGSVIPGMVSPQLNHNLTNDGKYEFRLVVSDGDKSSESTHSVQVTTPVIASCFNNWKANKAYSGKPGTSKVEYLGYNYVSKTWWSKNNKPNNSANKWVKKGACNIGIQLTISTPSCYNKAWSSTKAYSSKPGASKVHYLGRNYVNKTWWSKNDKPNNSTNKWVDKGVCQ
jgi:hypothetical protein